jgi:hypothetical protein
MKMLNTSLEPIPLGKIVALGLAAEYREYITCEENIRKLLPGSQDPRNAVKVVGSNPPIMAIDGKLVKGDPGKPRAHEKLQMDEDNPLTNAEAIKESFRGKVSHLEPKEREMMISVSENYIDLFKDETGRLRCTNKGYHEIRTGDAVPIKKNVYKVPYALRDEMKEQLDNMVAKGVITPCASPWAAPVILVPVDGTPKYRFCTDFRALNAVTQTPVYPIPDVKLNLSLMAGSKYFTLVDIENAYWNIPIQEQDKDEMGFITPFGSFRYERLAFGLSGVPSTFCKVMDHVLLGLKNIECLVYLDDILIFSSNMQDHVKRLGLVFDRIRDADFKLNLPKCTFAAPEVIYLGHKVNADGITLYETKVTAIRNFPTPRTLKEVSAIIARSYRNLPR